MIVFFLRTFQTLQARFRVFLPQDRVYLYRSHGPVISNPSCYCLRLPTAPSYRDGRSNMLLSTTSIPETTREIARLQIWVLRHDDQRALDIAVSCPVTDFPAAGLPSASVYRCRGPGKEISSVINSICLPTLLSRSAGVWSMHVCMRLIVSYSDPWL
ncbi:hypothetical protein PV04_09972 [Phialophora macrospora]|uniref:Uncharacterized protein n=1 Tax=Phialophora macrospora TaxID=1851006 RepID=A0A0D2F864_9EURO|nr:hypothetical protein PV04_09972 [Phialophora macrospora]